MLTFTAPDGSPPRRVLVAGDVVLDRYLLGSVTRVAAEAPVPVFAYEAELPAAGAAGNVAASLAALGVPVDLVGPVGDDAGFAALTDLFAGRDEDGRRRVRFIGLRVPGAATLVKARYAADRRVVFRADVGRLAGPLGDPERPFVEFLENYRAWGEVGCLALVDYGKGSLSGKTLVRLGTAARNRGVPILLDSKAPGGEHFWKDVDLVKMNAAEFEAACRRVFSLGWSRPPGPDFDYAALQRATGFRRLVVTCGAAGLWYAGLGAAGQLTTARGRPVPAALADPTGAGDVVTAVLAAALAAGRDPADHLDAACQAAGLAAARFGTCVADPFDLQRWRAAQDPGEKLLVGDAEVRVWARACRQAGKKVVFTNGCFDLLHLGHVHLLREARRKGDALFVAPDVDASVAALKGAGRPLVPYTGRASVLASLADVDAVHPHAGGVDLESLVRVVEPDVLVKGAEWQSKSVAGADFVAAHGGDVVFVERLPGFSTSALVEKARAAKLGS